MVLRADTVMAAPSPASLVDSWDPALKAKKPKMRINKPKPTNCNPNIPINSCKVGQKRKKEKQPARNVQPSDDRGVQNAPHVGL